jgi:hypothetical protein
VHIIAGLRNRMDSLAAQALSHIEAEGLYVNGEAHPLIPALGILLSAGTAHRQLAIDRRAFAIDYGTQTSGNQCVITVEC